MTSAPKKWRQWMPLDVDDFLTSDDVLEMTAHEFKGYTLLLLHQWKSEDGYLPLDEDVIRRRARLTAPQWEEARAAIMRKFVRTEAGYSNPRCRAELDKVLDSFQRRVKGAEATNLKKEEKRLANAMRSDSGSRAHDPLSPSPSPSSLLSSEILSGEKPVGLDREGLEGQEQCNDARQGEEEKNASNRTESDNRPTLREEKSPGSSQPDPRDHAAVAALLVSQVEKKAGATPSPASQQGRVEAPVSGANALKPEFKPKSGFPWPDEPKRDVAIRQLLDAHPRPAYGYLAVQKADSMIDKLARERGKGEWEAYTYLLARFEAYKRATDRWPVSRHSRIQGVVNFLGDEVFRQRDSIWEDDGDGRDSGTAGGRTNLAVLSRPAEAGGNSGGGGGRVFDFSPENIAAQRAGIRQSIGPSAGRVAHKRLY